MCPILPTADPALRQALRARLGDLPLQPPGGEGQAPGPPLLCVHRHRLPQHEEGAHCLFDHLSGPVHALRLLLHPGGHPIPCTAREALCPTCRLAPARGGRSAPMRTTSSSTGSIPPGEANAKAVSKCADPQQDLGNSRWDQLLLLCPPTPLPPPLPRCWDHSRSHTLHALQVPHAAVQRRHGLPPPGVLLRAQPGAAAGAGHQALCAAGGAGRAGGAPVRQPRSRELSLPACMCSSA